MINQRPPPAAPTAKLPTSVNRQRSTGTAAALADVAPARRRPGTGLVLMCVLAGLAIGAIEDRDVRAWVNEGEMNISLLGMSYLQRYQKIEITEPTTVPLSVTTSTVRPSRPMAWPSAASAASPTSQSTRSRR